MRRSEAGAWAAFAFGVVAALAYFGMRLFEQRGGPGVSPLAILGENHTGYYWRVGISLWWGALGAYLTHRVVARRRLREHPVRWFRVGLALLGVGLAWLALVYP